MSSTWNPNQPNILFKAQVDGDFIAIRTYCRAHGARGRFLLNRAALDAWRNSDNSYPFYDKDCGNFLSIRLYGNVCEIEINWLSSYGDSTLIGFAQYIRIPQSDFLCLLETGAPIRRLCKPPHGRNRFETMRASATISRILKDKHKRHAFRKAMRDSFHWNDDNLIRLYRDGGDNFYFKADGDWRIDGGLILHEGSVQTEKGEYPKLYYGMHT